MLNNILFVFEGEKTEKTITDNLTKYFVNENQSIQCAYCNDIYELHKEICADEYLDTFVLLRDIPQNTSTLSKYTRADFSEIYLFFDYDGHDNLADDQKVLDLLTFFNEETSAGKLYMSYPMVEALKHIPTKSDFKNLKVDAKQINYKKMVDFEAKNEYKNFTNYTRNIWIILTELHLKKANFIINNIFVVPEDYFSQAYLFQSQKTKYIQVDETISVVSSFPVFLLDYYGYKFIAKLINDLP